MMKEIEDWAKANMPSMEPEVLAQTWMHVGVQGFEQLQKCFGRN